MHLKINILLVVLPFLLVNKSNGLKCYTCGATENDADTTCVDDLSLLPANGITDCDKKYCTIIRIEYLDPKGKLASMARGCQDKVPADGVTEYSTFRTYQRSCKEDLCNSGSGKSDTNSGSKSLGDKSTIYAPGTGRSSGKKIYGSALSLLCCLIGVLRLL